MDVNAPKSKLYIETTIISYLTARPSRDLVVAAHQQITQTWWDEQKNFYDLYISQLVVQEVSAGDQQAVERRLNFISDLTLLALKEESLSLTRALISEKIIPTQAIEDALHIAIATIHGMEYLLTWNCKHIANAMMRNKLSVCIKSFGYEPPVICTPEELLEV